MTMSAKWCGKHIGERSEEVEQYIVQCAAIVHRARGS